MDEFERADSEFVSWVGMGWVGFWHLKGVMHYDVMKPNSSLISPDYIY